MDLKSLYMSIGIIGAGMVGPIGAIASGTAY